MRGNRGMEKEEHVRRGAGHRTGIVISRVEDPDDMRIMAVEGRLGARASSEDNLRGRVCGRQAEVHSRYRY
jgi:hypothetical protein